jgi:hypothetical protein
MALVHVAVSALPEFAVQVLVEPVLLHVVIEADVRDGMTDAEGLTSRHGPGSARLGVAEAPHAQENRRGFHSTRMAQRMHAERQICTRLV